MDSGCSWPLCGSRKSCCGFLALRTKRPSWTELSGRRLFCSRNRDFIVDRFVYGGEVVGGG